jgi:DHA1 family tetracycline resistance protein-like MFS transporter
MIGLVEMVKGFLAFFACPLVGRISDSVGRKYCLLISVIGTCLPTALLFLTGNVIVFIIAIACSGFFSATFGLTFAYISDCVEPKERAVMYGFALATFGLSLSIGPLSGGYLAQQYDTDLIFGMSVVLALIDVTYILILLPETRQVQSSAIDAIYTAIKEMFSSWSMKTSFALLDREPLLRNLALVIFLYYISVYALVSTFMLYITRSLHFDQISLGWLMSSYGLCTMISESMLVKPIITTIGELNTIRLGLGAFALQCFFFSFSTSHIFIYFSFLLSMLSSLVYPTICSLLANNIEGELQGESLGVLNGIKALTEGFGPLLFGSLMSLFEHSPTPSVPYLPAGMLVLWALLHSYDPVFAGMDTGKKSYMETSNSAATGAAPAYEDKDEINEAKGLLA